MEINEKTIQKWSEMTDNNLHNELRLDVAQTIEFLCGTYFNGYVVFFDELLKRIKQDGYLDTQLSELKETMLTKMLDDAGLIIDNIADVKKCF